MKNFKYFSSFGLGVAFMLFLSCSRKEVSDVSHFCITKTLCFSENDLNGVVAIPFDLAMISDDVLIVYDMETDYGFKAFRIGDFKHLGNFVRRGRGPDEEVFVFPSFRRHGHNGVLFQGLGVIRIGEISFLTSDSVGFEVIQSFQIPSSMFQDYGFFKIGDSIFSSVTFLNASRDFKGFCIQSSTLFDWGEVLPLKRPKNLDENDVFFVVKYTTVKPSGKRFATAFQNLPIVRIYCSGEGKTLNQLQLDDYTRNRELFEMNSFEAGKGFKTFFVCIRSTDNYIFGLYVNKEILGSEEGIIANDFSSTIHVFDWDGNPVMKLELDRPIFSFDVTPDNKQIIAISITDPDHLLVAEIPWD